MVYLLLALILALGLYLYASSVIGARGRKKESEDIRRTSSQLDSLAPGKNCPCCASPWWPDALRCWNCGYDTRAEDSEPS